MFIVIGQQHPNFCEDIAGITDKIILHQYLQPRAGHRPPTILLRQHYLGGILQTGVVLFAFHHYLVHNGFGRTVIRGGDDISNGIQFAVQIGDLPPDRFQIRGHDGAAIFSEDLALSPRREERSWEPSLVDDEREEIIFDGWRRPCKLCTPGLGLKLCC